MDIYPKFLPKKLATLSLASVLTLSITPTFATTWMIGDNDGYGTGIADNADHPFDLYNANYDGRSPDEVNATNGAQYTDTYSTTHTGYAPQDGTVATFTFDNLGDGWTEGSMWFDMADFQASRFGAVSASYNGIDQNWSFNDGAPHTNVRFFDLEQDVIDSINELGVLNVVIDRSNSGDFYGFDYAMLSNNLGVDTQPPSAVPVPAAAWLFLSGLLGFVVKSRKTDV
jgi:hypothetical protein